MTPKKVRELLAYDPLTGGFTWKKRKLRNGFERIDKGWNTRFAGKMVAIRVHRFGHCQIGLHCRNYMAHRLAWMIHYGIIPSRNLDHINGDPQDNRIVNLRLASQSENLRNSRLRKDNTSGYKGVSWDKKSQRWQVYIKPEGRNTIALGRFAILEDAIEARKSAEQQYHGEFARAA